MRRSLLIAMCSTLVVAAPAESRAETTNDETVTYDDDAPDEFRNDVGEDRELDDLESEDSSDLESVEDETRSPELGRLSTRWFWAGLALTVLGGGASVLTGALAVDLNDDYLIDRTDRLVRQRGMELQLTTNVLFGLTGAFALATALLAVFTDWSTLRRPSDDEATRRVHAALTASQPF